MFPSMHTETYIVFSFCLFLSLILSGKHFTTLVTEELWCHHSVNVNAEYYVYEFNLATFCLSKNRLFSFVFPSLHKKKYCHDFLLSQLTISQPRQVGQLHSSHKIQTEHNIVDGTNFRSVLLESSGSHLNNFFNIAVHGMKRF